MLIYVHIFLLIYTHTCLYTLCFPTGYFSEHKVNITKCRLYYFFLSHSAQPLDHHPVTSVAGTMDNAVICGHSSVTSLVSGMRGCTHSCPQTQYCFHLPIDVTCALRTVAVPLLRIQRAGLLSLPGGTAQAHIVLWLFLQDSTGWAQAQARVWSQVICGALSLQQPCYHCVLCFQNPAK